MTVTYSLDVSKARLCGFAKLLLRWRGSIYKLLYREMLIFCGIFYSLGLLYRYVLPQAYRVTFEKLSDYCGTFTNLIPLSFVLGFYVSIVVTRWWDQYVTVPWPDKVSMLIAAYVQGHDERGRIIRRTLIRYLLLLQTLTFQAVSTSVRKRFPTEDHIEEAGMMTKEERIALNDIPCQHGKWWVPAQWFTSLATRARIEGRIKDDYSLKHLLNEMHKFRGSAGMMFSYDWISIPLVYTQVVTLATYTYFLATIMGRQYLNPDRVNAFSDKKGHEIDIYVPVFTLLEFFFYMGWLKVAEQLINPYGEDDDDLELNWMLDRNLVVSYLIVDHMNNFHPTLEKDIYYDESEPVLPYTRQCRDSSLVERSKPFLGSAMRLDIDPESDETLFMPLETILEENQRSNNSNKSDSRLIIDDSQLVMSDNVFASQDKENPHSIANQSQFKFLPDWIAARSGFNLLKNQSNEGSINATLAQQDPFESEGQKKSGVKDGSTSSLFLPRVASILRTPKGRHRTYSMADNINNRTNLDKNSLRPKAAFSSDSISSRFDCSPTLTRFIRDKSIKQEITPSPAYSSQREFKLDRDQTQSKIDLNKHLNGEQFVSRSSSTDRDMAKSINSINANDYSLSFPYPSSAQKNDITELDPIFESNQSTVTSIEEVIKQQQIKQWKTIDPTDHGVEDDKMLNNNNNNNNNLSNT